MSKERQIKGKAKETKIILNTIYTLIKTQWNSIRNNSSETAQDIKK